MDKSREIFGNTLPKRDWRKAERSQKKFIRKFGDDRHTEYHLRLTDTPAVGEALGVRTFALASEPLAALPEKPVIIGNIRMGFGHYRISMAMASAARAMGCTPCWLDLHAFAEADCGKIIRYQNDLYSFGSRLSQTSRLFNRLVWEPMNSEGFRKLSYNAADQKNAELMTAVFRDIPRETPLIATHVWPAQAAVHAGMTRVVNAIPDNWPMALHLAEGSIHTVQTPSAFLGYKALRGMAGGRMLKPMPAGSLYYTGHYIDHELVTNIDGDCGARLNRLERGEPLRYLLTVGGAGAQQELFRGVIAHLLPRVQSGKAALFLNVGDHRDVWEALLRELPALSGAALHFDDFGEASAFAGGALQGGVSGVHVFCDRDIFSAVYTTNLLMRASDFLLTKPSELAFYPVPKLMLRRVGGHEAWGAIRSAEVGDGTYELDTLPEICHMLDLTAAEPEILAGMCGHIRTARDAGVYSGAYRVVELATGIVR